MRSALTMSGLLLPARSKAMAPRNETAAAIWPHLAADRPAPREQPRQTSPLAAAMYPGLAAKSRPLPSNPQRDALLRNLRDLNAKIDARLKKGK
jgi:hypothetical protein